MNSATFTDAFKENAADVNLENGVDPFDALFINRRYIGILGQFPRPDWLFEERNNIISSNITIDENNFNLNIKSICTGDANADYHFPKSGDRTTHNHSSFTNNNETVQTVLCAITIGSKVAKSGDTLSFPVILKDTTDSIAAFGFRIQYDTLVLKFNKILNVNSVLRTVMNHRTKDSLNIAWSSDSIGKAVHDSVKLFDVQFVYYGGYSDLTFLDDCVVVDDSIKSLDVTYNNGYISPLYITEQPENINKCPGENAEFDVTTDGDGTLTYQWLKSNTIISDATNSTFNIQSLISQDAGNYKCIISNEFGSITSSEATLKVLSPPAMALDIKDTSLCGGTEYSFVISTTGTKPQTYQWYKGYNAIEGAVDSVLTINNVSESDNGYYYCRATNQCGYADSYYAMFNYIVLPEITQQPISDTVCAGSYSYFSVTANGTNLIYQWFKNDTLISRATSNELDFYNGVLVSDIGQYKCMVSNSCDTIFSDAITLLVNTSPEILTQPEDTICGGTEARLSFVSRGSADMTFQWHKYSPSYYIWTEVSGATDSVYTISSISNSDYGYYYCYIANGCGNINTDNLYLMAPPQITNHLVSDTTCSGEPMTFTIEASDYDPYYNILHDLTYQWQKDGDDVSGATNSVLEIESLTTDDAGLYSCVVSNLCSSMTSDTATLGVNQAQTTLIYCPGNGMGDVMYTWSGEFSDNTGFSYGVLAGEYTSPGYMAYMFASEINGAYYPLFTALNCSNGELYITPINRCLSYSESTYMSYTSNPSTSECSSQRQLSDKKDTNTASVALYPNPNDGSFNLDVTLPNDGNVNIEAYNILGDAVLNEKHFFKEGLNKLNLTIPNAVSGIYFMQVKTANASFNSKFVMK